jgi:hypothetical protein
MQFDRHQLEQAFGRIGQRAIRAGKLVEIAIYGGSALVLTLPGRVATRDVDAVFQADAAWLRQTAIEVASECGWPDDNDAVKGFLSAKDNDSEARHLFRTYPSEQQPGLRVFVASPRYLFAMKCLAMRLGGVDETQDRVDIESLARHIGITDAKDALTIVCEYYPQSQIPPKTRFGIEEIFGALPYASEKPAGAGES